jgi:hypothetical protein
MLKKILIAIAAVYTVAAGDVASAVIPLAVGFLCAFVAYGRWRLVLHCGGPTAS